LPVQNTTINSSEFTINDSKLVTPQSRTVNFCEFEKLKDDYLNLLEEKKFVDSQLEKLDQITKDNYDLKFQIQTSKEKINELNEKLKGVNIEKKSLNDRCTKTSKENSEMLIELNKLREILNHQEKEKKCVKAKLGGVNNKLKLQEKEISSLKKKHQNLHFENKNLKEKIEDELFAKNNIEKKYIEKLSYFERYIDELQNSNAKLTKENILIFLKNINENEEISRLMDFKYIPEKNLVEIYYESQKVTEITSKNMNSGIKSIKNSQRSFFLDLSKIKLMNNDTQYLPRKRNSHRDKLISQRNVNPSFKASFGVPMRDITNISDLDAHSRSPAKQSLSSRIPQINSMTETKEKYQPIYSKIFSISSHKSSNSNSGRSKFKYDNKFGQNVSSTEFVIDTKGSTYREDLDVTTKLTNLCDRIPTSHENDCFTNRENENPNPRRKIEFNKFKYIFSSQPMKNKAICLDELLSNEPSPQVTQNNEIYKKIIEEEPTPVNQFENEDDEEQEEQVEIETDKGNVYASYRIQNVAKLEVTSGGMLNQKFNNLEVSKTNDSIIANEQDGKGQAYIKSNAEKNYSINISNNNILDFSFDENNKRNDTKMESTVCDAYIVNKE
jgi:hypothetical protein